jgi:hypothetical protein
VAGLTWKSVLSDIKRIIFALKGFFTVTLARGFDKLHQKSLLKPTVHHQTEGKVCDIIEDTEASNSLVKVIHIYRDH